MVSTYRFNLVHDVSDRELALLQKAKQKSIDAQPISKNVLLMHRAAVLEVSTPPQCPIQLFDSDYVKKVIGYKEKRVPSIMLDGKPYEFFERDHFKARR